jgi:hypothetical protein
MWYITYKWGNPATGVPLRPLDLDNIRTQVCQQFSAISTITVSNVKDAVSA